VALLVPAPAAADPKGGAAGAALVHAEAAETAQRPSGETPASRPKNRAASLRAILARLDLGEGAVVADIGAGRGNDSWVFAQAVGESGTVFSEEIFEKNVKAIEKEAEKKGLAQVRAVLGKTDDPCLPADSVDMAYMHYVYHHMAKPRPMLRGIWRCLKPGGCFVVVDRHRGTLRDWVERSRREKKHFFIAETTVVREAREEGFAFVGCPDDCWHKKEPFVLIFRRPKDLAAPGRDPDPFEPLPVERTSRLFLPLAGTYERPVFVALGEARQLMGPILRHSSGEGMEIVLEEWATRKDERGPLPENVSLPSTFTKKGDPHLPPEPVDAVCFLDSYHLLFHGKTLLARLHERLSPSGCVYVLDRKAGRPLPRREASHRRQIRPETVKEEMAAAGFSLWFEGPAPAPDRFLLVFGKRDGREVPAQDDPFIGGPQIGRPPEEWLRDNAWRLRGLRTADGKVVPFSERGRRAEPERASPDSGGEQILSVPGERLRLVFEKRGDGYALTACRSPAE
jgi:predicted methyltransferase